MVMSPEKYVLRRAKVVEMNSKSRRPLKLMVLESTGCSVGPWAAKSSPLVLLWLLHV